MQRCDAIDKEYHEKEQRKETVSSQECKISKTMVNASVENIRDFCSVYFDAYSSNKNKRLFLKGAQRRRIKGIYNEF